MSKIIYLRKDVRTFVPLSQKLPLTGLEVSNFSMRDPLAQTYDPQTKTAAQIVWVLQDKRVKKFNRKAVPVNRQEKKKRRKNTAAEIRRNLFKP